MKKVWHDERREKESALREQQEAVNLAQNLVEENKKLKSRLTEGEKSLISTATSAAELEMEMAKRAYKEAYDSGDSDKIVETQEKLNNAGYRLQRLKGIQTPFTRSENSVQNQPTQAAAPRLDQKTDSWRKQNTWFGQDEEMTATALGLHQKLEKQYGGNTLVLTSIGTRSTRPCKEGSQSILGTKSLRNLSAQQLRL
jgi:predicted HNH restriction endonuclease